MAVERIVSGGQTGVDRAALDMALELGIDCGGWCPRGRLAEDGPIAERYPLGETPSEEYAERTRWNVRDSDGTLILTVGAPAGGTALTQSVAERTAKPCLVMDLDLEPDPRAVADWIDLHRIKVLNVAGPRASTHPEVYERAAALLRRLFAIVGAGAPGEPGG